MSVLFCHDGPIRRDEFNHFYGVAHNDDTFKRYLSISDQLSMITRVSKVSRSEAEKKFSRVTLPTFKVIECPNISSLNGLFLNKSQANKIIREAVEKTDYVVARLPSVIGFKAIDYAKKFNKPYLVEVVACPWDAFWNHSLAGKVVAPFMYYATKKRVKEARYAVYVTNEFLQRRYPTEGKSVNCSNVALKDVDESILEKRLEKIKNKKEDSKLIIGTTAAVNVRYKGQQFIIEALGKLKKRGIERFEYQLVGGGDQTYLKRVAEKHGVLNQVKFLGSMPHDKVFEWLDTIDIYVQPSRQEGLPRALIEAMSRGAPAFGARTAGIPELLDEKFIFSNTKNNINEICSILLNEMTRENLLKQAERNYWESLKYSKDKIEARRQQFFLTFKNSK